MNDEYRGSVAIGGPAGYGIIRAGWLLGKAFATGGLYSFVNSEYPSLIRGGHNFVMVNFSPRRIGSHWPKHNILIAFDELTIKKHIDEVMEKGVIIYDSTTTKADKYMNMRDDIFFAPIPLTKIVKEAGLPEITRNTVAIGAFCTFLCYRMVCLYEAIKKAFKGKQKVIDANIHAAELGKKYVEEHFDYRIKLPFEPPNDKPKFFISGNEAISVGGIAAGMTWYSAYPMTPASPILHYLVTKQYSWDFIAIQPENELAAILMAIGASYAGARAMTGTSGGGFSLMTEALGHSGMTENPIVIVLAQRPGPSTGVPTYTAQGDLRFAIHASQGEFTRVVIAPGDVSEAFYYTQIGFNLAEKYQIPVIILEDKHLGESWMAVDDLDKYTVPIERGKIVDHWDENMGEYKRYKLTEDGISPRAFPGTKNAVVRVEGNEHTEDSMVTYDADIITAMNDKRLKKMKYIRNEIKQYSPLKVHGDQSADICLVGWGSTKGAILDSLELLKNDKIKAKFIQVVFMVPFPDKEFLDATNGCKKIIDIENNATGQLAGLIREKTGIEVSDIILKYDGRPFYPTEIYEKVKVKTK